MPKFLKFLLFLALIIFAAFTIPSFLPSSDTPNQNTESVSESVSETEVTNLGTVVIDAGHGGHQ